MYKKVLCVIDCQNDFTTGCLSTPESKLLIPALADYLDTVFEEDDTHVIFTQDTHNSMYLKSSEGRHLPIQHCILGTAGWDVDSRLLGYIDQSVFVQKHTFGSPELMKVLSSYIQDGTNQIEFVGLCTDICVLANAVLAKTYFSEKAEIIVNSTYCAGTTPVKHQSALDVLTSLQITVISNKQEDV